MGDGARALEIYLGELRSRLGDLPEADVSEIVAELRSHVRDSAGGDERRRSHRSARPAGLSRRAGGALRDGSAAGASRAQPVAVAAHLESLALGERQRGRLRRAAARSNRLPHRGGLLHRRTRETVRAGARRLVVAERRRDLTPPRLVASPPAPQSEELLGFWIIPLGMLLGALALWLTAGLGRWTSAASVGPRSPRWPEHGPWLRLTGRSFRASVGVRADGCWCSSSRSSRR